MVDVFDLLRQKFRTEMNNYTDDLATGNCRSFEEYQKLCGVIQGLAIAERHVLDLKDKLENDPDD